MLFVLTYLLYIDYELAKSLSITAFCVSKRLADMPISWVVKDTKTIRTHDLWIRS